MAQPQLSFLLLALSYPTASVPGFAQTGIAAQVTGRTPDPIAFYDVKAGMFADAYERLPSPEVHAPFIDFIGHGPGLALDVGAGSGRDAAWLASLGYDVVAAEPADGMRKEAASRHPDRGIRWIDDRLPDLSAVHKLGLAFDLILVSAVWMHVPPSGRSRAFRKLVTLLKPGGVLLLTLRHGPDEPGRPMWPTSAGEIEALARSHGLMVVRAVSAPDRQGRPDVSWTSMCLRLPDDGAGALPLIRGIILNDDKSSTYKLALLRSIARIADSAPAMAVDVPDEDAVDVPLGLVALNWIRMYLPLVGQELPQAPRNAGPDGLGFAKDGFRSLSRLGIAAQDLRIGAQFSGDRALAVAKALGEARATIANMPANFTRYPNSAARVFAASVLRAPRVNSVLTLDAETLPAFGSLRVPGHIWRAMQRLGAWIEPVLTAEWARMMRAYADGMSRPIPLGAAEEALVWLEPSRDTRIAREAAQKLLARGTSVRCVWTGVRLKPDALDIDHCLPWSAWPCGDLWNLFPASRRVNQHLKRDRLPSASVLAAAREEILAWWTEAWDQDATLSRRFRNEVAAALPIGPEPDLADAFVGLEWRRLKLRQDQQLEEWAGVSHVLARSVT